MSAVLHSWHSKPASISLVSQIIKLSRIITVYQRDIMTSWTWTPFAWPRPNLMSRWRHVGIGFPPLRPVSVEVCGLYKITGAVLEQLATLWHETSRGHVPPTDALKGHRHNVLVLVGSGAVEKPQRHKPPWVQQLKLLRPVPDIL